MRKCLLYTASIAILLCVIFSIGLASAEDYTITLNVDFEENMIFSKYDVDVFIDDIKVGTYPHGENFTAVIPANDGNHTIWFYEEDNTSNSGSIDITVNSDAAVKCHIECKRNQVKVTKVEINRAAPATKSTASTTSEEPKAAADNKDIDDIGNTKITNDGVSITLVSYTESKGDSFMPPDDGNIYLVMDMLIENNGSDSISLSTIMDFTGYCDGYTADYSFGAAMATKDSLDGTIAAGKKMKGQMAFEVPKNWQEFELHVQPNVWKDEVVFVFHKK